MSYISEFLSLRCAGDVINSVGYVKNYEKEISEAMGVMTELRKIVLKRPNTYSVLDLCSGNALVPILSSFIFPIKKATAIDKRERERNWENVRKFSYLFQDIYSDNFFNTCEEITDDSPTILTSCHACGDLANRSIDIFDCDLRITHLILIPCCSGNIKHILPTVLNDKCSQYEKWCYNLYKEIEQCSHKVRMFRDKRITSPKNIVIVAEK